MIKIIYFDEGSATDFLSIINDGELINEFVKYNEKEAHISGDTNVGAGISKLFGLIKGNLNSELNLQGSFQNSDLIKTTISNTILTDFISYINSNEKDDINYIVKLSDYKIIIPTNSIAMFQQITPYMLMTNNDLTINEDLELKLDKMYEALEFAKGYYELIGVNKINENDRRIFRFNNKAFKNNYSVSDLVYMDLVFYGIKVGKMKESLLDFNNLIDDITLEQDKTKTQTDLEKNFIDTFNDSFKGEDINISEGKYNEDGKDLEYTIYDIILAGVDNE